MSAPPRLHSAQAATELDAFTGSSLSLRGLECRFGDVVAVDGIDLDVASGEFVSLLGPSGSGKTTTLMMIAGFERPTGGHVIVSGEDMSAIPPHKRDIGMVFQSYALFPHMTVAENVAYPLRVRGVPKAERRARVARVLDLVRLPSRDYGDRRPQQLSGGQQQRVALSRALVYEPRVLLMDEPMGALDRNLRAELQLEIKALHGRLDATIIYVTHDQEEALTMSDRIALFKDGKIEQVGTPRQLYEAPVSAFAARFLGEANLFDGDGGPLMVRPERVQLTAPGQGRVSGRVRELVYLGPTLRAGVETPLGPFVVKAPSAGPIVDLDEPVGLTWEPSAAVPVRD